MKALIIDEPWISKILSGEKTWEMRARTCNHRGPFGLIRKGSGQVVGVAEMVDCLPAIGSSVEYAKAEAFHRIPADVQGRVREKWNRPWVLKNAKPLRRPVHYQHKSGAVTWVELDPHVAAAVAAQV
ncbi:MAG TPA: ASCH domain-containing protein [Caulobacteraceae bacterium]|nr:ASCH domain-containing protein [Caulobacteraceae bacterium]